MNKYPIKYLFRDDWDYQNYEQNTTNMYREIVQRDWVTFDCGARDGYFTLLFSELGRECHSFEPSNNFSVLTKNIEHYNLQDKVKINNLALSDKVGSFSETIYESWPLPTTKIYNFTTIDSYVLDNKLDKVDLIKIDCDSFELDILRGCIKTLWALSPVVVVELNSQALGLRNTHIGAVKHFLAEQGYSEIRQSEENSTFKKLL